MSKSCDVQFRPWPVDLHQLSLGLFWDSSGTLLGLFWWIQGRDQWILGLTWNPHWYSTPPCLQFAKAGIVLSHDVSCRSWSVLVCGKNCRSLTVTDSRWPLTVAQAARRSPPFVGPEARGPQRGPLRKQRFWKYMIKWGKDCLFIISFFDDLVDT